MVTGVSGFVGSALLEYLVSKPFHKVVVTTRRTEIEFQADVDSVAVGNLTKMTDWNKALNNIDCVIHLAARVHVMHDNSVDPLSQYRAINVESTINLARQAANSGVKRFIFISSINVSGAVTLTKPFFEGSALRPHSDYAVSKLEAEDALLELAKETGMDVVIIRPPLVYGFNAPGNFSTLLKLVCKVPFLPFGLVKNKRSFISVVNLCSFISLCIDHPKAANEVFLISDNRVVSTTVAFFS